MSSATPDGLFPDNEIAPLSTKTGARYLCAQCGAPGAVDPGFAQVDARFATGTCTGTHVGPQYLVREGFYPTEKKRPSSKKKGT